MQGTVNTMKYGSEDWSGSQELTMSLDFILQKDGRGNKKNSELAVCNVTGCECQITLATVQRRIKKAKPMAECTLRRLILKV